MNVAKKLLGHSSVAVREIHVGGSIEVRCLDWAILMVDSSSWTRLGIASSWSGLGIWTGLAMMQLAFEVMNRLENLMACIYDVTSVHVRSSRNIVTVGPMITRV